MKTPLKFSPRFFYIYLIIGLLALGVFWFFYSRSLIKKVSRETLLRSRIYAKYVSRGISNDEEALDIIFGEVIEKIDFPVVVTDEKGRPSTFRNLPIKDPSEKELKSFIKLLDKEHRPIPISVSLNDSIVYLGELHYGDAGWVKGFKSFPFIQSIVLLIFILIGIWGLLVYTRSERERIWTSLAKETAHQLGTPLSSLSGWLEVLKNRFSKEALLGMEEDLKRARNVLERFSRIGLPPLLKPKRIGEIINETVSFIKRRASKRVEFKIEVRDDPVVKVDEVLFSWTLENLLKNGLDAIGDKEGRIEVISSLTQDKRRLKIEVKDTGTGIKAKRIFAPGVTTKPHGWGVGLTLAKRIVEEYHRGKLILSKSGLEGTTFTILLPL